METTCGLKMNLAPSSKNQKARQVFLAGFFYALIEEYSIINPIVV
jgi:hypothetical protein